MRAGRAVLTAWGYTRMCRVFPPPRVLILILVFFLLVLIMLNAYYSIYLLVYYWVLPEHQTLAYPGLQETHVRKIIAGIPGEETAEERRGEGRARYLLPA